MKEGGENITELLVGYGRGDKEALDKLMPIVYDELRRQAARYLRREQPGHTMQTTALIHEAYVRLVDQRAVAKSRTLLWHRRADDATHTRRSRAHEEACETRRF